MVSLPKLDEINLTGAQQTVLELVAELQLQDGEAPSVDAVLLKREPAHKEGLLATIESLVASDLLEAGGSAARRDIHLTPTSLLLHRRSGDTAIVAESLLEYFKRRLRDDGGKFLKFSWADLKTAGVVTLDEEYPLLVTVVRVLELSGSSALPKGAPARAWWGVPDDIVDLRALSDIRSLRERAELRRARRKTSSAKSAPSPPTTTGAVPAPAPAAPQTVGAVDVLVATALTEENQVVRAVLDLLGRRVDKKAGEDAWTYATPAGEYTIVAVSAHSMGVVPMSIATTRWLVHVKPQFAVLVGIAAAVKTKGLGLGYVPLASQVLGYGDIAVEDGKLEFRSEGFHVDKQMSRAAGALRSDVSPYEAWQSECRSTISKVLPTLNKLRHDKVVDQAVADHEGPHLVVGVIGSGPFLLRDADFREKLVELPKDLPETNVGAVGIGVAGPIHPKLVSAEMEAHGFMAALAEADVPGTVLKGISDLGDADKAELEKKSGGFYRAFACANAVIALLHMLRQQPRPPVRR